MLCLWPHHYPAGSYYYFRSYKIFLLLYEIIVESHGITAMSALFFQVLFSCKILVPKPVTVCCPSLFLTLKSKLAFSLPRGSHCSEDKKLIHQFLVLFLCLSFQINQLLLQFLDLRKQKLRNNNWGNGGRERRATNLVVFFSLNLNYEKMPERKELERRVPHLQYAGQLNHL